MTLRFVTVMPMEHHISEAVCDTVNSCILGTMKIVMVLTTAVMLMDLNIYADACKPPTNFADGCSGVADFKFTDDCNKHDICYACVSLKLNLFSLRLSSFQFNFCFQF